MRTHLVIGVLVSGALAVAGCGDEGSTLDPPPEIADSNEGLAAFDWVQEAVTVAEEGNTDELCSILGADLAPECAEDSSVYEPWVAFVEAGGVEIVSVTKDYGYGFDLENADGQTYSVEGVTVGSDFEAGGDYEAGGDLRP